MTASSHTLEHMVNIADLKWYFLGTVDNNLCTRTDLRDTVAPYSKLVHNQHQTLEDMLQIDVCWCNICFLVRL